MDKILTTRILKSINESIRVIYYTTQNVGYIFFISGTSDFIYKVIINKNIIKCNCEDFYKTKLCKHICFVLFKVLSIYKINLSNFEIKLINDDKLSDTNFFINRKFPKLDWFILKKKVSRIEKCIKRSNFDEECFKKFKYYYNQYYFLIHKKIENTNSKCSICSNKMNKGIKCPVCKKYYHTHCLMRTLNKLQIKKCPKCGNDYWNLCYKYMKLLEDKKIDKNIL